MEELTRWPGQPPVLNLCLCLIPDFYLLWAASRRAGFTPLSGRWLFPWILTRTWTSTGGTRSSSTRAGSSTRGLPTSLPSLMLLTKPWRDDPKTPALSSQVGWEGSAWWWASDLCEIPGGRRIMVWLMTAFYKRNFIKLKAAHLHLNPCVEIGTIISYLSQELVPAKSWICACRGIMWAGALCLFRRVTWDQQSWACDQELLIFVAGLTGHCLFPAPLERPWLQQWEQGWYQSDPWLDPGTLFPWCPRAQAALKGESPGLGCWTVAPCAAAGQAFSSNNIPLILCVPALFPTCVISQHNCSKSAQQQPGRGMAVFRKRPKCTQRLL